MLRPTFAPRLTTIAIEPGILRGALLRGRRVVRWHSVALPKGAVRGSQVQDPGSLAQALRMLLKAGRLPPSPLVVGLPASGSIARVFRLPKVPRALLGEAVQRLARQELPVSLDQLQLSWTELKRERDRLTVLVVAVPRGTVEGVSAALRIARLRPRCLDLNLLATARLSGTPDVVAVQIEQAGVSLLVIRSGAPEALRSFTSPDLTLTAEGLTRISEELARTLQYQQSLAPGDHAPQPMVLAAPAAARAAVAAAAPEGVLLTEVSGPCDCPPDFPRGEFIPNLGLAVGWGRDRWQSALPALSLLPRRSRPRFSKKQLLLVGSAALAAATLLPLHSARIQAENRAARLEQQLPGFSSAAARRRAELKATEQAKEQLEALQRRLDELNQERSALQGRQTNHALLLGLAIQALPPGVQLATVKFDHDVLALSGTMPQTGGVLEYRERLEVSGAFAAVVIRELIIAGTRAPVRFSIEATRR